MNARTIALILLVLIVAQIGMAIGKPREEEKPWTADRKRRAIFGLAELFFTLWLIAISL